MRVGGGRTPPSRSSAGTKAPDPVALSWPDRALDLQPKFSKIPTEYNDPGPPDRFPPLRLYRGSSHAVHQGVHDQGPSLGVVFAFHESPGRLAKADTALGEGVRDRRRDLDPGRCPGCPDDKARPDPAPTGWPSTPNTPRPTSSPTARSPDPFAKWYHRHNMLDDGQGGTILRDVVDYEVPLGALGRLFGGGFVRSKLVRMFDYRHEVTRKIVEAGDSPASRP